jgi:hypothetical protein
MSSSSMAATGMKMTVLAACVALVHYKKFINP